MGIYIATFLIATNAYAACPSAIFPLIFAPMNCPTPPTAPFFIARTAHNGQQCDAWPDRPLLVSLEQGGIDWPSSCRNGTCRTCIGQLTEGQVRYAIDWPGLSAEEHAAGCILPCVAYPVSDVALEMPSI